MRRIKEEEERKIWVSAINKAVDLGLGTKLMSEWVSEWMNDLVRGKDR